jgi:predicted CXXCH cytochrome family protein
MEVNGNERKFLIAASKTLFLAGMAFLLYVFGTVSSLGLESNDAGLPIQQGFIIDVKLLIRQGNMRDSCSAKGCHQKFDFKDALITHKPFVEGHCENCHAPAAHLQQITSTADDKIALCYECHSAKSLGVSHPMGEKALDPTTGKPITCATCHSPHYANKTNLLILDGRGELCLRCHTEFLSSSH